ncbi:MAG: HAD-IB family hydrolase [Ruminococcaceae bacterium]|nr:HAD-IB family hydrolase [Oscillospiraceae bacterium]
MKKRAAFFDIDGTISREGLISEMFKKMIRYELIDTARWQEEVKPAYSNWNRRMGDYDLYLQKMVDIYSETVVDTSPFHIEYIAGKVVEQSGERVYTYSRDKIKWHKNQGHLVIAISGSPIELVRQMSEKYEMDDYRGTIYEVDENNIYTGKTIPMWDSRSKCVAIEEIVEKFDIDLAESYGYGDTAGDFSMLEMVGHPFAINPTKELITKILAVPEIRKKVTIIVERKDTTYKLDPNNIEIVD